jgi:hypothetical protein
MIIFIVVKYNYKNKMKFNKESSKLYLSLRINMKCTDILTKN